MSACATIRDMKKARWLTPEAFSSSAIHHQLQTHKKRKHVFGFVRTQWHFICPKHVAILIVGLFTEKKNDIVDEIRHREKLETSCNWKLQVRAGNTRRGPRKTQETGPTQCLISASTSQPSSRHKSQCGKTTVCKRRASPLSISLGFITSDLSWLAERCGQTHAAAAFNTEPLAALKSLQRVSHNSQQLPHLLTGWNTSHTHTAGDKQPSGCCCCCTQTLATPQITGGRSLLWHRMCTLRLRPKRSTPVSWEPTRVYLLITHMWCRLFLCASPACFNTVSTVGSD